MTLIITHREDYTADYIIHLMNQRGLPYHRFNCEDCLRETYSLLFSNRQESINSLLQNIRSVWYRRVKLPELRAEKPEEKVYLLHELDAYLQNLFGIIPGKWLSSPYALQKAENKFYQLQLAQKMGFSIPTTLVTSNKEELIDFYQANRPIIVKPIARSRIDYLDNTSKLIFTNKVTEAQMKCLDDYILTPCIYQQYIEKAYELRVTVVESEVFAAKVDSQSHVDAAVDWRKKKLTFEPYTLPEWVQQLCRTMLKELDIGFGAFDLIRGKDGEYYFLEVNPNGQWVWIEKDTGLPISEAILKFLTC